MIAGIPLKDLVVGALMFEERYNGLVDWSPRVGGFVRKLDDDRELHLVCQLMNVRVSIGKRGVDTWDDSW